jgi:hypothetical protein
MYGRHTGREEQQVVEREVDLALYKVVDLLKAGVSANDRIGTVSADTSQHVP